MADQKSFKPLDFLLAAAPVFTIIALLTFAGPCGVHDDGSVSPCFHTSRISLAFAVLALGGAVMHLLSADQRVRLGGSVLAAGAGVAQAVAPGTFLQLCMMSTMRCHTIMRPTLIACGALTALFALATILLDHRSASAPQRAKRKR